MAYKAACPSCGAPVSFRSPVSLMAVCEFCRSTLVRHDKNIEDIGKMADLLPDQSILQIGTEGVYQGKHFGVIGRIQVRYEAGVWSEWHILFDDMRSGWLSEAGGVSWLTFPSRLNTPFAASRAGELFAGHQLELDKRYYEITNIDRAECVAGEGELPFRVGAGYSLVSIDLRSGDTVATLDCSHDPALFFSGMQVALSDLNLSNIRDLADQAATLPLRSLKSFQCPRCAAPLTVYSAKSETIACGSCGALVEADNPTKKLVDQIQQSQAKAPRIPLGQTGRLYGQAWTVIGFLIRKSGIYSWQEYLLMNPLGEFSWLVCTNGHWSFGRPVNGIPKKGILDTRDWNGQQYKHFERYESEVSYALGEFYWRVKRNDTSACNDYIAPPYMLAREGSQKEESWTLLEHMDREEVQTAFGLSGALPEPTGVGAIEPNPYEHKAPTIAWQYLLFAIAAFVIHLCISWMIPQGQLAAENLVFEPRKNEEQLVARFQLDKPVKNAVILGHSRLDNNWIELGFTLTNEKTGEELNAFQEVSYYSGRDSDGFWSEGSQQFRAFIGDLTPGDYLIHADAELGRSHYGGVATTLNVAYGETSTFNLIIVEIFLLLVVMFVYWRKHSFEVERWANSDHPMVEEEDDE